MREIAKFASQPKRRIYYAAPTYRQGKAIAWTQLKEKLVELRWAAKVNESDLSILLKNGSTISVRGTDNFDSLRGVGLNFLVMDEFADCNPDAWFRVLRPTLSDTGGHALFLGTPKGRNHLYEVWQKGQNGETDWESWQFTTLEGGNVPEEEIEAARRDLDDLTFQAEYLASFVTFEGRAYKDFQLSTHCKPLEYNPQLPLIFCHDFNIEPGVAAVCQEQRDADGKQFTAVIGEVWIPRSSSTPAVCRKLIHDWGNHWGEVRVYADATGGARGSARVQGSDLDLIRNELFPVFRDRLSMRVPRANPAERVRVNAMNSRIMSAAGDVRLYVDPVKAPHVVRDLEGVALLKGGSGELDKKTDPMLSHMCFAAGTVVDLETGPCRIEDAPITGRVRTWDGSYVDYDCAGKTISNADIVSISISNGDVIYCTPWHQFFTDKGWICASELNGLELKSWRSRLSRTANRISTGHRSIRTERSLITQAHTTARSSELIHTFIERCGNTIMAQFRRACTSITKTVIERIIKSGILNASHPPSTSPIMRRTLEKTESVLEWLGLNLPVPLLQNGIGPQRDWSGTAFKAKPCGEGSTTEISPLSASIAVKNTSLQASDRNPLFSVARRARRAIATIAASTMKTEPAPSAKACSPSTSTARLSSAQKPVQERLDVVDVQVAGRADVYCLHVPSTGCFALDNGAIVSNSDALGYYIFAEFPIVERKMTEGRMMLG